AQVYWSCVDRSPTLPWQRLLMTEASSSLDRSETRGLALGFVGVVIFAMTLPMTRLAVGAAGDPQLPPLFVTAGRAAFAGLLAAAYLLAVRAPWPRREHRFALFVSALGTVVGFPLFLALALRHVDATHAAVVTGVLPLATAIAAAVAFRQRPSPGFWLCAVLGCARSSASPRGKAAARSSSAMPCCSARWRAPPSATLQGRGCRPRRRPKASSAGYS